MKLPIVDRVSAEEAYRRGFDCAIHGANEQNCHFSTFATPELTAEWERGKRDATAMASEARKGVTRDND